MKYIKWYVLFIIAVEILSADQKYISDDIDKVCMYPKTPEAYKKLADTLTGYWTATNHSGYMMASGFNMPIPADPKPEKGFVFFVQNGELVLSHPKMKPMVLKFADEPKWKFSSKEIKFADTGKRKTLEPLLTDRDIELWTGCENVHLPRFIGKTVFSLDKGQKMNATYRFMVIDGSSIYGFMEYSGVAKGGLSYKAKRAFAFTRDK